MPPKNIKQKLGSVIEPQKVDQDLVLGTTSNIDLGDHPSPSTMSILDQSTRDNEVSGSADIKKVVARQPPPRPHSPTEPVPQWLVMLPKSRISPQQWNLDQPSFTTITTKKEVRSQQIDYLNKRFQAIQEWVKDNPNADEPAEEEFAIEEDKEYPPDNNEENVEIWTLYEPLCAIENVLGEHTIDNEGLNISTSAKPSTRHVYPNGKTFDKMLNDPRFVNIPGSTRNIGDKLEWADRVVGQMMRAHSMRDGQSLSVWHKQGITFDDEGNPHHRETPTDREELRQHSRQLEEGNHNVPHPRTTQGTLVAARNHYPSDSSSSNSSSDSFDGYRPPNEGRRGRTPWLESESSESDNQFTEDRGARYSSPSHKHKDKKRKRKAQQARALLDALANKGHDEYNCRLQSHLITGIR
ncbi:hypothetical protein F5050DRAFT_1807481 [Lentinula boryana]|uniref:Uncharacterized protein n=1 Tax=Lentinula boryana TaxID=40481 RepID=A0ABQ8QE32_9AGAR|nr:hypothetical protein F5050DRAFT_1807481 [Lentinula boryana]